VGAVAAGCAGAPRSAATTRTTVPVAVRVAVVHWRAAGGTTYIDTLAGDFAAMSQLGSAPDWKLSQSCYHLLVDVGDARAFASIPDTTAQHLWTAALDAYSRGGIECAHGADAHDYDMVARASTDFDTGTANIRALTTRLHSLGG
jgi:hypothetical protein